MSSIVFLISYYLVKDSILFNIAVQKELEYLLYIVITGSLIGFFLQPLIRMAFVELRRKIKSVSIRKLCIIFFGLFIGLLLSLLFSRYLLRPFMNDKLIVFINILLILITTYIMSIKEEELFSILNKNKKKSINRDTSKYIGDVNPRILDTSVIIDGRIFDIYKEGFLDGTVIIPNFVLEELQHIADSEESHRREKGRRGLDILKKFQSNLKDKLIILNRNIEEKAVDHELISTAAEINAQLITNDFNLAKLAELHGIGVLNVNTLANTLKPSYLPGDEVRVKVIKEGQDRDQGIAYLEDGTMVVVEHGRYHIGQKMDVLITSILQKNSGRMFFAEPLSDRRNNRRNKNKAQYSS